MRKAIGARRARRRRPAGHPRDRPRPVADAVRARRAARRRGVRRGAHVLPHQRRDAGQPHAVPRARAARHADRRPAQLARVDRRRARAQRRDAELRRAGVRRRSSASRTASRRPRSRRRCATAPDARAAFIVSPTYYGMAADVAGLRRGRAPRRRAARRRPVVGPALRLQRDAAADRAVAGRRRDAHEHAQDRRLADAERDAARRPQRPRRRRRRGARAAAAALDQPVVAAARVARRRAPPARAARRAAAARDARGDRGRAREARDDPGHRARRRGAVGRMGVAGYDPLRIVLDVRGTGRTGYEIADALRRSYDVHVELPMQATRRVRRRPRRVARPRCGAWRATSTRSSSGSREPGATAPIVPPAASLRQRGRACRRARRSSARPSRCAVDDAVGRISCESIASYPPGVPALLPGERISAETVAYLRELADSGARLHGASDPDVPDHQRARGGADDRPAGALGAVRREARLRGPAHLRRRAATPRTRRSSRASTSRSSARRWTTSSPTARARASRRARSARASCPPGPHLEVKVDAFAELRVRRLRRRAGDPGRPGALARRDRGDGRPGARAPARMPVVLGGDHSITEPSRARLRGRRTARSASSTSTPTPTPARRCSASSSRTARSSAASSTRATSTRARYAQIGLRGYWPGRGGVRLAGRARDHEPVHARRPRPRHPRGGRGARSRRSARARST